MATVTICERWTVPLPDNPSGDKKWFLDWVLSAPGESKRHLTASWHAYSSLVSVYRKGEIRTAREYFGGIGGQSFMIDALFHPSEHVVLENAPDAVGHLLRQLPAGIVVKQADSYSSVNTAPADLVGLDYGDLTAHKLREGADHAELLERVALLEPRAIVLTDIAGRFLHFHRESYERVLGSGTCEDYPSYLLAMLALFRERYGYGLVAGFYHRWSTVLALVPLDVAPAKGMLVPTPLSPVGLELKR